MASLLEPITAVGKAIDDGIGKPIRTVASTVSAVNNQINNAVSVARQAVNTVNQTINTANSIVGAVQSVANNGFAGIVSGAQNLVKGQIVGAINHVTGSVASAVTTGLNSINNTVNGIKNAVNGVASTVNGVANLVGGVTNQIGNILDDALSFGGIGFGGMGNGCEDFNQLRQISHQLVHTEFALEWNFRIEIEGAPDDLDFYVKDISITTTDISTDEERYGSATMVWPTGDNAVRFSMTCRDNFDGRISRFLSNWWAEIIPEGGIVGLPLGKNGYVKKVKIYKLNVSGEESLWFYIDGHLTQVGDVSMSRENGNFQEIPITIQQFSTLD